MKKNVDGQHATSTPVTQRRYEDLPNREVFSFHGIHSTTNHQSGARPTTRFCTGTTARNPRDSFDDPKEATKYKKLLEQIGPDAAQELMFGAEALPEEIPALTVTEWCTEYIDHLTGVEEATEEQVPLVPPPRH